MHEYHQRKKQERDTHLPKLVEDLELDWFIQGSTLEARSKVPHVSGRYTLTRNENNWVLKTDLHRAGGYIEKPVLESQDLEWLLSLCRANERDIRIEKEEA